MPRKEAKKSRKGSEKEQWSEWGWSIEHNCYYRTRVNSRGEYEYDYPDPEPLPDAQPQSRSSTSSREWNAPSEDRGRSQNYDPEDHIALPGPPSVSPTRPRNPSPPRSPPPKNPPPKNPPPKNPPPANPPRSRHHSSSTSGGVSTDTYSGSYSGWKSSYGDASELGRQQWPADNSTYNADLVASGQMNTAAASPWQQSLPESEALRLRIEGREITALASTNNASFISNSFATQLGLESKMASNGRSFEISRRKGKITEIKVKRRVEADIGLLDYTGNHNGRAIRDWLYVLPKDLRLDQNVFLGREHIAELKGVKSNSTMLSRSPKQQHRALPLRSSLGQATQGYSSSVSPSQLPYDASAQNPRTYSMKSAEQYEPLQSANRTDPGYGSSDPAPTSQNYSPSAAYYPPPPASSSYEARLPAASSDLSTDAEYTPRSIASDNYTFASPTTSYSSDYLRTESSSTSQNTNQPMYPHDPGVVYEHSWQPS